MTTTSPIEVIEASAGTGKTWRLAERYVDRILAGDTVPRIVVVTFTRAATAELRHRIRARLRAELRQRTDADARLRLGTALGEIDQARISTIHGFCARLLVEHAFTCAAPLGRNAADDPVWSLHERVMHDLRAALPSIEPEGFEAAVLGMGLIDHVPKWRSALHTRGGTALEWQRFATASLDDLSQAIRDAEADVCAAWPSARSAAIAVLTTGVAKNGASTAFSKGSGLKTREALDALVSRLDQHAAEGRVMSVLGDWSWLTRAHLVGAATKAKRTPVGDAWDALLAGTPLCAAFDRLLDTVRVRLWREYEGRAEWLRVAHDHVEHDDFVRRLADALQDPDVAKQVAASIDALLIDEVQDTDPLQFAIVQALADAGVRHVVQVGDIKQSIYAFRGADVDAWIAARRALGSAGTTSLTRTWRADAPHQRAIDVVFGRGEWPGGVTYPGTITAQHGIRIRDPRADERALQFLYVRRVEPAPSATISGQHRLKKQGWIVGDWVSKVYPHHIAAEIGDLLERGVELDTDDGPRRVRPDDIAVLVRTRYHIADVVGALTRAGLRATAMSDASVYTSPEAADLIAVIRAIEAPANRRLVRAAMATDLWGATAAEIRETHERDAALESVVTTLRDLARRWESDGLLVTIERVMRDRCTVQWWLDQHVDGERRLTDLRHLIELVQTSLGTSATPGQVVDAMMAALAGGEGRLDGDDPAARRIDTDRGAIRVMTMHRSKGLTFPIVVCPMVVGDDLKLRDAAAVTAARIPDTATDDDLAEPPLDTAQRGDRVASVGPPPSARVGEWQQLEQLAEAVRLLYVAMTRAKHRTIVGITLTQNWESSAMAWLIHALGDGPPASVEDFTERLEPVLTKLAQPGAEDGSFDDSALIEALEALVALAPDAIGVRELTDTLPDRGQWSTMHVADGDDDRPARPQRPGAVKRPWRITSFTQLRDGTHAEAFVDRTDAAHDEEGADVDVTAPTNASAPDASASAGSAFDATAEVRLARFARGPHVGDFLHDVLEHAAPTVDTSTWRPLVERAARRYGVRLATDGADRTGDVLAALADMQTTPLGATSGADASWIRPDLTLADVAPGARVEEMEFHLPLAGGRYHADEDAFVAALPDAMAIGLTDPADVAWAAGLTRLATTRKNQRGQHVDGRVRGFLKGLIDLVFEADGRFYVLDYKSNHLGDRLGDYAAAPMQRVMREHDYLLQAHLYLVAVHRHLARTVPGYDYDTHMGGLIYAFVRGMTPDTGGATGVWAHRPPRARVDALAALFDEGRA